MRTKKSVGFLALACAASFIVSVSAFAAANLYKAPEVGASEPLFSVSGENSSVTENFTYNAKDHENPSLKDGKGYPVEGDGSVTGVKVSLASGDYFKYEKVIDFTGKTKDKPLFEFSITPDTVGVKEADAIEVTFTDAYDESNSVKFMVTCAPDSHPDDKAYERGFGLINGVGYLRAGVNGEYAAMQYFNNGGIKKTEGQGAIIFLDFAGIGGKSQWYPLINTVDKNVMSVYYDDAEKQIFTDSKNDFWDKGRLIADLDDEEYFTAPWSGFTTGECFMTIRATKYSTETFNFVLTSVDGERVENLTDEKTLHRITADTLGYDENDLPKAFKGEYYPAFTGRSVSPYYGELPVAVKAFYGDENGEEIEIENGRFLCAETGRYTLVYECKDPHGRTVTKKLTVTAIENEGEFSVTLGSLDDDVKYVGKTINLPSAKALNAIGKANISVYVVFGGERTEITGETFRPQKAGEYEIEFVAEDIAGRTAKASVKFTAKIADIPVFEDVIPVPKYFTLGRKFKVPEVYAYDYSGETPKEIKTKVYLSDKRGERLLSDNIAEPFVERSGDTVKLIYDAEINGKHNTAEFDVPVIDVKNSNGELLIEKFFYAAEGSCELKAGETEATVLFSDDFAADYINPLAANGFVFEFSGVKRFSNYKSVSLVLSDALDSSVSVRFTYTSGSNCLYFSINGEEKSYRLPETFGAEQTLSLSYNSAKQTVSFSSSVKINAKITGTENGEAFNGFPSGKVYARIEAESVGNASRLKIKNLGDSTVCDITYGDYAKPVLFCNEDYGGEKSIGEKVRLPRIYAVDAIDTCLSLKLTVTDPKGNPVIASDGTLLSGADGDREYDVIVKEYGSYVVSYVTTDENGNRAGLSYNIAVLNANPPEITINGEVPVECRAGEKVVLPSGTAKDDKDGEINVMIYVTTEDGKNVALKGEAFVFKTAGTYKVTYWCADGEGNICRKVFTVTVK